MQCNLLGHQQQIMEYLCINQNCKQILVCCDLCRQQFHFNHLNDCLKIKQIRKFIEKNVQQVEDDWNEKIDIIKICLQENFERQQLKISNIFEENLFEDEEIHSLQFTHFRKQQILQFIKMQNLIQKFAHEICKMTIKMQDQISLAFDHINCVQVQIKELSKFISYSQLNQTHCDTNQQEQINSEQFNIVESKKKIIILDSDNSDFSDSDDEEIQQKEKDEFQNKTSQQKISQESNDFLLIEEKEFHQLIDFQNYQQLIQNLERNKKVFTDKYTNNEKFYCQMNVQRISDLKSLDFSILNNPDSYISSFFKYYHQNSLHQTNQNDYFDSLMYYLVKFCPLKLKELFITSKINYLGIYGIYMIKKYTEKRGQILIQIVDDKIPKNQQQKKCNYDCLIILKKAIAKYYGGYDFFNILSYQEALYSLFSVPVITIKYNQENFIETLENEIIANSFILFTYFSNNQNEFFKIIQILGMIYIRNVFDEQVLLIKLKSAYGRNFYKGEWGFQSPLWTEDLLNYVNYSQVDDGIFYMDYFSLIQQSQKIYCWRINQKEIISEQIILRMNQSSYLKIEIHKDDNLALCVFLEDQKKQSKKLYQFIIAEIIEDSYNLINLKFILYDQYFELFLQKGSYIIFLKNPYLEQSTTATISIFGSHSLSLTQIQKIEDFKQQIFQNQVIKIGKELMHSNIQIKKLDYSEQGWKIYQFQNYSQNQAVKLRFNIPRSRNIQFCKPFINQSIIQVLKYNQPLLIILKVYGEKEYQIKIYLNQDQIDF